MVYHDISEKVELNKIGKAKATAHLMDRLFSFVIDYLVISPFVLFFVYICFHDGFSYLKSNPMADEKNLFYTVVGFTGVVFFSLVQAIFIYTWRATPGQHFLKVNLEFGGGRSLVFIRAFFRQVLGNLAFALLVFSGYLTAVKPNPYFALIFIVIGLSYMSYMTSRKRRTFYDQVVAADVVTLKTEKSFFDFEIEFRYWQSLVATLSIFAGVLLVAVIFTNYDRVLQRTVSLVKLQESGFFCEEMNQVPDSERLGTAIALNLVNQLSDGCLDRESDFVLWRQKKGEYSLAYYAKSLTTVSDEKEKQYLQQACFGENLLAAEISQGCRIATAFLTKNFDGLYSNLGERSVLNDILKYQVSLALNKAEEADKNFAALEKHGDLKAVKKFQVMEMISGFKRSGEGRSPASRDEEPNARLLKLVDDL